LGDAARLLLLDDTLGGFVDAFDFSVVGKDSLGSPVLAFDTLLGFASGVFAGSEFLDTFQRFQACGFDTRGSSDTSKV
jgi:hypothetical protein